MQMTLSSSLFTLSNTHGTSRLEDTSSMGTSTVEGRGGAAGT